MNFLVLHQYRRDSGYKDLVGSLYHFPTRYLKLISELPVRFVYYEPREGGDQIYFGTGSVLSVYNDTEDIEHAYAEIIDYKEFPVPVNFYSAPWGGTWEEPRRMRNSVRRLSEELFRTILVAGGTAFVESSTDIRESIPDRLQRELRSYTERGRCTPHALRRIRRILETFERPSAVTNFVKRTRGDSCQLCGCSGFLKRDGNTYCEVHHLFHLAKNPPADCLSPEFLIVLCATCHRRMHYAHVSAPAATSEGWKVIVDGKEIHFVTRQAR